MTFPSDSFTATGVEGTEGIANFQVKLTYTGTDNFWVMVEEPIEMVRSGNADFSGDVYSGQLRLRSDLAPGDYETQLVFRVCKDEECKAELQGSPVKQRLVYTVLPNIRAQSTVDLSRKGQEPSPSLTIPVSVPTQAGVVTATVSAMQAQAFDIRFENNQLLVNTQQVRAGQYDAEVLLASQTDPRYAKRIAVRYVVSPPEGGEQDMDISPQLSSLSVEQGQVAKQRIKFTRPSWTSVWSAPKLTQSDGAFKLLDLGNDEYEVSLDTASIRPGIYSTSVLADAGPLAGTQMARVQVNVSQPFWVEVIFKAIDENSTDLRVSTAIHTLDGKSANWSATSLTPWLRIVRGNGQTDRDTLEAEIESASLPTLSSTSKAKIRISIDRPGVAPIDADVWISINLPRLISPINAVWGSTSARLFVQTDVTTEPLRVTGARLTRQIPAAPNAYWGPDSLLAVDVTDITPGVPISIFRDSKWRPTSVTFQTYAAPQVPSGHITLPLGPRRTPYFSAHHGALYFASQGNVYRWKPSGVSWLPSQQTSITGLVDVALSADGRRLFGSTAQTIVELDPQTLAVIQTGPINGPWDASISSESWNGMNSLSTTADGRTLISVRGISARLEQPRRLERGVGWVAGYNPVYGYSDALLTAPETHVMDWHAGWFDPTLANDAGLLRSVDGHTVIGVMPDRTTFKYGTASRTWSGFFSIPSDTQLVAVADDGQTYMLSNGVLVKDGVSQGASLGGLLPAGYLAGGYGLSGDGTRAYIYGYKIDKSGMTPAVTDAAVWVVDIHDRANTPLDQSPIMKVQSLAKPVGCLSPMATGESCEHNATLTLAPGNRSLFISGPRGMAALTVPDYTVVAQPSRTIAHAQSLSAKPKRIWSRTTRISR